MGWGGGAVGEGGEGSWGEFNVILFGLLKLLSKFIQDSAKIE